MPSHRRRKRLLSGRVWVGDVDFWFFLEPVVAAFFSFVSGEVPAMLVALSIALGFTLWRARPGRQIRLRVLVRALFPKRIFMSPSGRADIALTILNYALAAALFGWALLSQVAVQEGVERLVAGGPGAGILGSLSNTAAALLATFVLYLGYEFGYWLDHYLMHKVEFLWPFHAVHHTAESLSPLTNFRVHPVDSIIFYNILAIVGGTLAGLTHHLLGGPVTIFRIDGVNAIVFPGILLLSTLQHTHLWISFSGKLGRWFLSPAHHQIHHSTDPRHFNKNFGSTLGLWDWLFGTLHVPQRRREQLEFGVNGLAAPHSVKGTLLDPFMAALAGLKPNRSTTAAVPLPGR